MNRRLCQNVIQQMLVHIPETKIEFINDLKWNLEDSFYKPPEETLQWERTMITLMKHIPNPQEEWERMVLSIYTTRTIEDLKNNI